jgi:hypothetical protein
MWPPPQQGRCRQWPGRQSSAERSPLLLGAKEGAATRGGVPRSEAAAANGHDVGAAAPRGLPRRGVIAATVEGGAVAQRGLPRCKATAPADNNGAAAQRGLPGRVVSRRNLSKTPRATTQNAEFPPRRLAGASHCQRSAAGPCRPLARMGGRTSAAGAEKE